MATNTGVPDDVTQVLAEALLVTDVNAVLQRANVRHIATKPFRYLDIA